MRTIKNYKDLKFWGTSFDVTKLILNLVEKFPNKRVYWIITDQLLRASTSIGANIAEGFGKYKGKEYQRFLQIALGSANEVEYWLLILKETTKVYNSKIDRILSLNLETIKMLIVTLKTLNNRKTNH